MRPSIPTIRPRRSQRFADAGATWTHVVDLDGARERRPCQHDLIAGLARNARQQLQVAGGFRNREQIAHMLDAGVAQGRDRQPRRHRSRDHVRD